MRIGYPGGIKEASVEDEIQHQKDLEQAEAERLPNARTNALQRIESAFEQELSNIKKRYPQLEREGWHELIKDVENGSGECLTEYANELGVSEAEAITRIQTARSQYRTAYGKATGKLTKLRDQTNKEDITIEELNDINWTDIKHTTVTDK